MLMMRVLLLLLWTFMGLQWVAAQPKLSNLRPQKLKTNEKGNYPKFEQQDVNNLRFRSGYTKPQIAKVEDPVIRPEDTTDYYRRVASAFSQNNNYYISVNPGVEKLATLHPPLVMDEPPAKQEAVSKSTDSRPAYVKPIKVRGYRIQLFNGQDRELANKARQQFITLFPDVPRYLMFVEPTYRVRVGDFFSRSEAEDLLQQLKKIPIFADAIIIRDIVEYKPKE